MHPDGIKRERRYQLLLKHSVLSELASSLLLPPLDISLEMSFGPLLDSSLISYLPAQTGSRELPGLSLRLGLHSWSLLPCGFQLGLSSGWLSSTPVPLLPTQKTPLYNCTDIFHASVPLKKPCQHERCALHSPCQAVLCTGHVLLWEQGQVLDLKSGCTRHKASAPPQSP